MPLERTSRHLHQHYRQSPDPWGHTTRVYERAKYERTLDALGDRPVRQTVEIGCGIGALTELLAPCVQAIFGIDCVPRAVEAARARLAGQPHVQLVAGIAPDDLPEFIADRIVLSEVLYFMAREEIVRLAVWCDAHAASDARIIIVSWLGSTGEPLSGPASASIMREALAGWSHRQEEGNAFRIVLPDRLDG